MEPVHMEAVATEIPKAETGHTSFNIVSKHNEDPHTYFGAITDPGNSVINIQNDATSFKFVVTRMVETRAGFRPATGSNVASGKKIDSVAISGIPFLKTKPSERDRMLNTLFTVDLARALAGIYPRTHLYAQPGVGYYIGIYTGDPEFPVPDIKTPMPHNLGYYAKLAERINYSRFSVPSKHIEKLIDPPIKGYLISQMESHISGIKRILNFESE